MSFLKKRVRTHHVGVLSWIYSIHFNCVWYGNPTLKEVSLFKYFLFFCSKKCWGYRYITYVYPLIDYYEPLSPLLINLFIWKTNVASKEECGYISYAHSVEWKGFTLNTNPNLNIWTNHFKLENNSHIYKLLDGIYTYLFFFVNT